MLRIIHNKIQHTKSQYTNQSDLRIRVASAYEDDALNLVNPDTNSSATNIFIFMQLPQAAQPIMTITSPSSLFPRIYYLFTLKILINLQKEQITAHICSTTS